MSTIYRQGKQKAFTMLHKSGHYNFLDTFRNSESSHDEVKRDSQAFILRLYGPSTYNSLDDYRHIAYNLSIGRSSLSSYFQLKLYHQPVLLPNNIPIELTLQCKNGWGILYLSQSEAGDHRMELLHQQKLISLLHPIA